MTAAARRLLGGRFWALARKELHQIRRDRRIIAALVLPPIMQLMLFGSVMDPSVGNIRLGLVDHSQSAASRDLTAALAVYPFEEPGIGPNNYRFDPMVDYELHVALGNHVKTGQSDPRRSFGRPARVRLGS